MRFKQFGTAQQQAHTAQPHGGVRVGNIRHEAGVRQRLDIFLAAPVQHTDGDGIAVHRFHDAAIGFRLGVLIRHGIAIHEQKLGAQQTYSLRTGLRDQWQFHRQFEIRLQLDLFAIRRFRRQTTEPRVTLTLPRESGHRAPRGNDRFGTRVQHDSAGDAVHHHDIARPRCVRQTRRAKHRRHAQSAQHHRGVTIGAALVGRHAGQPRGVEQRGVRWPQ